MKNIISDIFAQQGIKHFALVPVENGALALYLVPYAPFDYERLPDCLQIDSYYVTSNRTYFENIKLLETLREAGFDAKRYRKTDIKEQLLRFKLADFGLNRLCFVKGYGSFFFVATVYLEGLETAFYSTIPEVEKPLCTKCGRCLSACPQGALDTDGFSKSRCLRQLQEAYVNTPEINAALKKNCKLLGCNICQLACPLNRHIKKIPPPEELSEMCDRNNIGDTLNNPVQLKKLAALIGKNYASKSFLQPLADALTKDLTPKDNSEN